MAKFTAPIDLTQCEARNLVTQNLSTAPSGPLPGQRYYSTVSNYERYWNGTRWVDVSDGWVTPTAPVDMGGQIIINLGTPVAATDAATKGYVDSVATGLDVKNAVRAASTATVTIATPGASIDGVALAVGDRVLLKNQTAGAENGIYVWNGAAVPMTRAADADSSAEVTNGMFALATAGTTNAGTGWLCTTPDPITLGTTALVFAQFSSAGATYIGTANRITVTGNVIDIAATYTGQASITTVGTIATGTWQATPVAVLYGGTGATTAAGARANLGVPGKVAVAIGNGTVGPFTVTHNFNTFDVLVEIYETTSKKTVYADVVRSSVNAVDISGFTAVVAVGALTVVVTG